MDIFDERLENLLEEEEGHELDFKSADLLLDPNGKNQNKIARHLVAFANRNGGEIVFGVDDESRDPEGKPIDEELALNTISQIARMSCSPPIQFEHQFYSEENGDLEEGSIFIVDIEENISSPPHAITDNSNGEIQKREYRIRSGDETRLVADGELQALFEGGVKTDLGESFPVWSILERDEFTPKVPEMPYDTGPVGGAGTDLQQPRHYDLVRANDVFEDFPEYKKEYERENGQIDQSEYAGTLLFITVIGELYFNYSLRPESFDQLDSVPNIESQFALVDKSELVNVFSGLDIPPEIIVQYLEEKRELHEFPHHDMDKIIGFPVPSNCTITCLRDGAQRIIEISSNDGSVVTISIDWIHGGLELPEDHPLYHEERRKGGLSDYWSTRHYIRTEAEFTYPEQDYESYQIMSLYYEKVTQTLEDVFSWEKHVSDTPDPQLLEINGRLREIEEKLEDI